MTKSIELKFNKFLKFANPTTISFSLIDFLVGVLAITYVNLTDFAVISSASTLIIISTVYMYFQRLKKSQENIEEFLEKYASVNKAYGKTSIILSLLDVLIGILIILSFSSTIASTGLLYKGIKTIIIGGKVIHIKKAQNLARTTTILGLGYANYRKTKFLKGAYTNMVKFFKTAFAWLWANKKTLLGTATAILAGIITAISANLDLIASLPDLLWLGINWTGIIAGLIIFILAELGISGKGFESIKAYTQRIADLKIAKTEAQQAKAKAEAQKIVEQYEKAKALLNETVNK